MSKANCINGTVPLGNTEMQYVRFGSGDRVAVLLPGLSDGLATVGGKARLLAKPYKPYWGDYTIYMFSRKNVMPEGYTISDMADDQAAAMKALGIGAAYVLGVSQGGVISQYLAARHPECVRALALTVTAPYTNDVLRAAVASWVEMAKRGDHKTLMRDTAEKTYSDGWLTRNRALLPLLGLVGRQRSYDRFLKNAEAILNFDARPVLDRITCPTLIIGGDCDKTVGTAAASELHELIAGSELHIYKGLGHGAYEEAKDFNRRVFDFFGSAAER